MYVTPYDQSLEATAEPIMINLLIDGSGSMDPVKPVMPDCVNYDFIGALKGINSTERTLVRLHAEVFGTNILSLWQGFRALRELNGQVATEGQFYQDELYLGRDIRYGGTGLFKCAKTGLGHLIQTGTELATKMNKVAVGKLIVFTDGANNYPPLGAEGEAQLSQTLMFPQQRIQIESILVYFRTELGLKEDGLISTAKNCGFNEIIMFNQHDVDRPTLQREIRRALRLLSERRVFARQRMPEGVTVVRLREVTSW